MVVPPHLGTCRKMTIPPWAKLGRTCLLSGNIVLLLFRCGLVKEACVTSGAVLFGSLDDLTMDMERS